MIQGIGHTFSEKDQIEITRIANDAQEVFHEANLGIIYAALSILLAACILRMTPEKTRALVQACATSVNVANSIEYLLEQDHETGKGLHCQ